MSWIIMGTPVSGGWAATASSALFLTAWMATRLQFYRRSSGKERADGPCQGAFPPSTYDFTSLLSDEDFDFLASLPGYKPEIGRKLRRDHERILRLYVQELAREFRSVHAEARETVAHAGEEHAPTVGLLIRQQLAFWQALARIELSFALPHFGARRWKQARAAALGGAIEAIVALRTVVGRRPAEAL